MYNVIIRVDMCLGSPIWCSVHEPAIRLGFVEFSHFPSGLGFVAIEACNIEE